jgi:hypothetical protein
MIEGRREREKERWRERGRGRNGEKERGRIQVCEDLKTLQRRLRIQKIYNFKSTKGNTITSPPSDSYPGCLYDGSGRRLK